MAEDTAHVNIRPWRVEDVDALYRLVRESHASLSRWLAWCHADYGLDDARRWIDHSLASWQARSAFPFAVVDAGAETLLGSTGLSQLDDSQKVANLGYWVGTPFVGQGIATEAARQAARFGFDQLGLQRRPRPRAAGQPCQLGSCTQAGSEIRVHRARPDPWSWRAGHPRARADCKRHLMSAVR